MNGLPATRLPLPVSPLHASAPPPVTHSDPTLYLALSGAVRVDTRDRRCVVPSGHLACVPPGVAHSVRAVVPTEAVRLSLPAPRAQQLQPHMSDDAQVHAAPLVLLALASDASSWADDPPSDAILDAWLHTTCGLIPRWCGPPLDLTLPLGGSPELRLGLAHLLRRLDRPVGLADAAQAGGVSQRTIQRRCAEELDLPLSGWLTRARVLHAAELLTQRDQSVASVAQLAGYQSAAAFTRAFSQHFDTTPTAWRAQR